MYKTILILSVILLAYTVSFLLRLEYVLTMDNITEMYGDVINAGTTTASKLYEQSHEHWILGLLLVLLPIVGKVFFFASVVYVAFYLVEKQRFGVILFSVVLAELVNVLMNGVKVVDLIFFNPPTSLVEMSIAPLSLASLFDIAKLDQWMLVPLSAANVFEVLYVLLLSFVLSMNLKQTFGRCFKVVVCSYGLVSVLIVVVMTFIAVYATR